MENKENKNKENKNNEESFKSKKSNIIIPIIIAIIILLILLLSIKSCSSNEKDPVNDDVVEESVDEVFSIDFIVDGSVYYIIETAGNSNLTFPQDPVVAGYDFIDWYFEDSFDTVFTNTSYKNVKLEENIEVYAKFEAITYSITYIDEFNQQIIINRVLLRTNH
ncbi:MAG: InlB B-repeat-containing protein [bacterium]